MIAYSLNADKGYVIVTIAGTPSLQDYIDTVKSLAKHPMFFPSTHRICDFSGGELSGTLADISAFVEEAKNLPKENSTKTALIARSEAERDMLEQFAAYFDRGQFKVFENGLDALNWIRTTPEKPAAHKHRTVRIHRLLGDVTQRDVLMIRDAWFKEQGFDQDTPILWDLRQARLRVEVEDLTELAANMQQHAEKHRPNGRTAVLVGSKLHEMLLKSGFEDRVRKGQLRFYWTEAGAFDFLTSTS